MGLYNLFGLDRCSFLTGLSTNVKLTGSSHNHEDDKDTGLKGDTAEICMRSTISTKHI